MAAFTVWKFDGPNGAAAGRRDPQAVPARRDGEDHRPRRRLLAEGASKPTTHEGHEERWHGTGWGALWGVLIGALFFVPVIGGVVGAGSAR